MRHFFPGVVISCCGIFLMSCGQGSVANEETAFTKQDSVMDSYLAYQDSMLQSWNVMINDDNQKLKAMHDLLHELIVSNPDQRDSFKPYEERLEQLTHLRYTEKSMANADVVEEYDFASSSLVSELISVVEAQPEFEYNTTLQTLAEEIKMADERVSNYRADYDLVVSSYNQFIEHNRMFLTENDSNPGPEKKPLFQMVSEE